VLETAKKNRKPQHVKRFGFYTKGRPSGGYPPSDLLSSQRPHFDREDIIWKVHDPTDGIRLARQNDKHHHSPYSSQIEKKQAEKP
jgi:hypothetical protein